jgi:hypothetical protein
MAGSNSGGRTNTSCAEAVVALTHQNTRRETHEQRILRIVISGQARQ